MALPIDRVIYCDIDGTLTDDGERKWGKPIHQRILKLNHLFDAGYEVNLWSANGAGYVKAFAEKHGVKHTRCLSKPGVVIDDRHYIRRFEMLSPKAFDSWDR